MQDCPSRIVVVLLMASVLLSPLVIAVPVIAQDTRERRVESATPDKAQRTWPSVQDSIVKKASDPSQSAQLTSEPVMRIALAIDARGATISTTARLLNASELNSSAQPLEVTRVRIESRLLSPSRVNYRTLELQIVRSVS